MSIRNDIDRGLDIRAEMEKLATELKDIEVRVKHAALHGEQVELNDADREGRQFLAHGSERIVPVILTADKLIASFKDSSPAFIKITNALGPDIALFSSFFDREVKFSSRFDSGKKFRAVAAEMLGDRAPGFITACVLLDKDGIARSDIKIMWDDTKTK